MNDNLLTQNFFLPAIHTKNLCSWTMTQLLMPFLLLLIAAAFSDTSVAWSPLPHPTSTRAGKTSPNETTKSVQHHDTALCIATSRRTFIATSYAALTLGFLSKSPAFAAADSNVFADQNFSTVDAKKRLHAAQKDLKYLVENYSEISKNGGDAVRNALGTQGVNSNLYGIQKVLKILRDEADDIVEYTEAMDEFNAYYYQAEGAAYQSLFVEHSSAKGTPEMFLVRAMQDIIQCDKLLDKVVAQLPN
jgi:hypothetical protein